MKIVINACFGGFSLSKAATARLAALKGRQCFFFKAARKATGRLDLGRYEPASEDDDLFWTAFDVPNPNEVIPSGDWRAMTSEEREAQNAAYSSHHIDGRPDNRSDPDLERVVEEMGDAANGKCAELRVVEIPDGTDWEIDEYDGSEHIAEKHRTWR